MFLATVYIHSQTNSSAVLSSVLHGVTALQTSNTDTVFIIASNFNQCNLRTVLSKYYQHVDLSIWDPNTLNHVQRNICGAYNKLGSRFSEKPIAGYDWSPHRRFKGLMDLRQGIQWWAHKVMFLFWNPSDLLSFVQQFLASVNLKAQGKTLASQVSFW